MATRKKKNIAQTKAGWDKAGIYNIPYMVHTIFHIEYGLSKCAYMKQTEKKN